MTVTAMRPRDIGFVLLVAALAVGGRDRAAELVDVYHRAEPPDALFVEVARARFLGSPGGWRVVYCDFVWSGAKDSYRGTQKLLVFDKDDRYVGSFHLVGPLDVDGGRVDGIKTI